MRVKFGNHIDLCKRIRHSDNSALLLITTIYDTIYTVNCGSYRAALELYHKAFVDGFIDVSNLQYSN